jgi:hypothetical protein
VPKLYHWPINNKDFLAFSGPSSIKRFGKFICHGLNFSYRNASTILPYRNRPRSHDDVRSDYFADVLGGVLYDILLKNNSFGITLFGRTETEKIIHDHISRNANYLNIIGFLLTIEHWSYLVTQAYKLANEINSYPLLRSFALYTAESHRI